MESFDRSLKWWINFGEIKSIILFSMEEFLFSKMIEAVGGEGEIGTYFLAIFIFLFWKLIVRPIFFSPLHPYYISLVDLNMENVNKLKISSFRYKRCSQETDGP